MICWWIHLTFFITCAVEQALTVPERNDLPDVLSTLYGASSNFPSQQEDVRRTRAQNQNSVKTEAKPAAKPRIFPVYGKGILETLLIGDTHVSPIIDDVVNSKKRDKAENQILEIELDKSTQEKWIPNEKPFWETISMGDVKQSFNYDGGDTGKHRVFPLMGKRAWETMLYDNQGSPKYKNGAKTNTMKRVWEGIVLPGKRAWETMIIDAHDSPKYEHATDTKNIKRGWEVVELPRKRSWKPMLYGTQKSSKYENGSGKNSIKRGWEALELLGKRGWEPILLEIQNSPQNKNGSKTKNAGGGLIALEMPEKRGWETINLKRDIREEKAVKRGWEPLDLHFKRGTESLISDDNIAQTTDQKVKSVPDETRLLGDLYEVDMCCKQCLSQSLTQIANRDCKCCRMLI